MPDLVDEELDEARHQIKALITKLDQLQTRLNNKQTFINMVIHELKHPIEQLVPLHEA